ncbi:hypothetical protein B0J14DRAFT_608005 [Halenospora varia]|nr:hypothetical protein B0J14DRAFT_608005 [Halenospora varia]
MAIFPRFIIFFLALPHLIQLGLEETQRHPIVNEYGVAKYRSFKPLGLVNDEFPDIPYDAGFEGPLLGPIDELWTNLKIEFSKGRIDFTKYWWKWFIYSANAERSRNLVEEIHVTGETKFENLKLAEAVFRRIKRGQLKVVRWDLPGPISESILRILEERHSNCRLYYSFDNTHFSYSEPLPAPRLFHGLQALINSTILYGLRVELHYRYKAEYDHLGHLFSVLSTAPKMRELELIMHDIGGCEITSSPFAFNFLAQPHARFPPLEVLKLNGYDLDERADGGNTWNWEDFDRQAFNRHPDMFDRPKRRQDDGRTNLDSWMEIMDWSHVHTLELSMPSKNTLAKLSGSVLPALTNVQLNHGWQTSSEGNETLSFLASHPLLLDSLSIGGLDKKTGNTILERFLASETVAQNLTHFSFRDSTSNENEVHLNESLLTIFVRRIPRLESLDINLRRDANMSIDGNLLSSFSSSPTLRRLILRIPSPDMENALWMNRNNPRYNDLIARYRVSKDDGDEIDPIFNQNTVLKMFQQIRSRKVGKELEELEFYVGNWDGRWERGLYPDNIMRVAHWRCSASWEGGKCEGNQTRPQ